MTLEAKWTTQDERKQDAAKSSQTTWATREKLNLQYDTSPVQGKIKQEKTTTTRWNRFGPTVHDEMAKCGNTTVSM